MADTIEIVVEATDMSARSLEEGKATRTLGSCEGIALVFEDISYRVPNPRKEGGQIEILSKVSGSCRPGRLTALMGSSGELRSSHTYRRLL